MNTKKRLCGLIMGIGFALGVSSAQASIIYTATLTGAAENPANASPGTGLATVEYDSIAHSLQVDVSFANLTGTTSAAHIHCCVAPPMNVGVTIPMPGFPAGVTSGSYSQIFDLTLSSSYSASFINNFGGGTTAGAEAALANGLAAGQAYFNVHTSTNAGGEIRGFLAPVPVPTAAWLFGSGLLGLVGVARRTANT